MKFSSWVGFTLWLCGVVGAFVCTFVTLWVFVGVCASEPVLMWSLRGLLVSLALLCIGTVVSFFSN